MDTLVRILDDEHFEINLSEPKKLPEPVCNTMVGSGHIFKPALQDISLKKFRLRYCIASDCYYLNWGDTVCYQLAPIKGLGTGAYSMYGLSRHVDEATGMVYLMLDDGVEEGEIRWRVDFSQCGLVVNSLRVRADHTHDHAHRPEVDDDVIEDVVDHTHQSSSSSARITFSIVGDGCVNSYPTLGDWLTEVPAMYGRRTITMTTTIQRTSDRGGGGEGVKLFPCLMDAPNECPLDITVDLMCSHRSLDAFVGDVLLGLKFNSRGASESIEERSRITVECGSLPSQLQVHVVEGAGLVNGETHKPINAFIRCNLLPDPDKYTVKQTSPHHNSYPTWSREFIFAGVSKASLVGCGLEVILYDHHLFFHDSNIGGVRLSSPARKMAGLSRSSSPDSTSSDVGEGSTNTNSNTNTICSTLTTTTNGLDSSRNKRCATLPHRLASNGNNNSQQVAPSPIFKRRSFTPSPGTSPISVSRNYQYLTPPPSPLPGRRISKRKSSPRNSWYAAQDDSPYLFSWMDSTGYEVDHWQQMLDNEGDWVYCWHTLRPKLKPAYN